MTSHK